MEKNNKDQPSPDNQPEKAKKEQLLVQNSTGQSRMPIPKPLTGEKENTSDNTGSPSQKPRDEHTISHSSK